MTEKNKIRLFPKVVGKTPYYMLLYLIVPIYFMFQVPMTKTIYGFSLLALFLIVYRQMYWIRGGWKLRASIWIQVAIIGTLGYYMDPGYFLMIFYPIGALPYTYPTSTRIIYAELAIICAILTLVFVKEMHLSFTAFPNLIPMYLSLFFIVFGGRSTRKLQQTANELKQANQQIERLSQETERQRIARDLHDTLGHTLSMITLKSELAEKLIARAPEQAAKEIRDVQKASRAALSQVRELVSNMHSVSLAGEMEHTRQILSAAGMDLEFIGGDQELHISSVKQTVLAMCLRELITNVVKHSGATHCRIRISQTETATELTVEDDGAGMDSMQKTASKTEGHGLYGIRQRLQLVEGALNIDTGLNQGTRIIVSVPSVMSGTRKEIGL